MALTLASVPAVIWFTGLSGAGKSTIADGVYNYLRNAGLRAERLDGDAVRGLMPSLGFTRADRDAHVKRVGQLASLHESHGSWVVASFISPYEEARQYVRGLCSSFFEVYVSTPLEVCEQRDPKGLYKKARQGLVKSFTGIDDPYERPSRPDLVIDTSKMSPDEAIDLVVQALIRKKA